MIPQLSQASLDRIALAIMQAETDTGVKLKLLPAHVLTGEILAMFPPPVDPVRQLFRGAP